LKTGNQLKICSVHFLAHQNAYHMQHSRAIVLNMKKKLIMIN